MWLYARHKGEPFAKHINTAFFGAALAPIFSEILFSWALPLPVGLPLAVVTTGCWASCSCRGGAPVPRAQGPLADNIGCVAGLLGTLTVAVYKSYGFVPDPVFIWTQGQQPAAGAACWSGLFAAMAAILGFCARPCRWHVAKCSH